MKERFEGADGRRNLLAVLIEHSVVGHQAEVAEALADVGELVEYKDGDSIINQGSYDTDTYFIVGGVARVFVNNREVGTRTSRDLVGEMVLLDASAARSATVKADGTVTVLKVAAVEVETIANRFPTIWRAIGKVLAERLRERSRFHRPQNEQPIMFIGCSTEGKQLAEQIVAAFKHDKITIRPWTVGVFGAGGVPIDDLLREVNDADFALFIFTPDDVVSSRGKEVDAPRDNVIFEMGLFIGRLGRNRTFMLKEHGSDIKIPSDLLGVTPLTYIDDGHSKIAEQLQAPCVELREYVRGLGAL